jgi:hypothetical protein
VWEALDKGEKPSAIERLGIARKRTAQRLSQLRVGFTNGLSDTQISMSIGGWSPETVGNLRRAWKDYEAGRVSEDEADASSLEAPEESPPSGHAVWAGDAVRQQAGVNHVRKLIEVAEQLERQLYLPLPGDAGSWIPPQGYRHGVLALLTGRYFGLHYCWEPQETDPGVIQLAVEGNGLYFTCLHGHIANNKFWTSFDDWKTAGAAYLSDCRQLVQAIVKECEARTGSRVLIDEEWPEEGVYWYFAEQVYKHCTSRAQGGLERIVYEEKEEPQGQGIIPTLWHGGSRVACHQDRQLLTEWKGVHQKLLAGNDWKANADALVQEHKKLGEMAKPIKKVLRFEIERGTFDGGTCQLCAERSRKTPH